MEREYKVELSVCGVNDLGEVVEEYTRNIYVYCDENDASAVAKQQLLRKDKSKLDGKLLSFKAMECSFPTTMEEWEKEAENHRDWKMYNENGISTTHFLTKFKLSDTQFKKLVKFGVIREVYSIPVERYGKVVHDHYYDAAAYYSLTQHEVEIKLCQLKG